MYSLEDTIAAIATPLGEGGLAVLRVSGKNAITSVEKFFDGKQKLSLAKTHTAHFGNFTDGKGNVIDEVVTTIFLSAKSYTGENVVEISCHGSIFVARKILEILLTNKIRLAEPGEFTKRAFLNGKIDLPQAEAVADLIKANSEIAQKCSFSQIKGELSSQTKKIGGKILDLCSMLELELDFVEEDYQFATKEKIVSELNFLIGKIENLLASYKIGRFYRDGVNVVISGIPNVGKSSLLNALLQENKAIVTEIPGTTRDVVEGELLLDGILFRFFDTAGIRETKNIIEEEGIRRSYEKMAAADLTLIVNDSTDATNDCSDVSKINIPNITHQRQFAKSAENSLPWISCMTADGIIRDTAKLSDFNFETKKQITVFNKVDLLSDERQNKLRTEIEHTNLDYVFVSAKTHLGIIELQKKILELTVYENGEIANVSVLTNTRHKELFGKIQECIKNALNGVSEEKTTELIVLDLRSALNFIGEITGEVTTEEILNNIFSKFCIGK
ncbi:MAG: tRNA uridine-5-carboxymethylaminomethyl(34) synthesis GTPase MnmE [Ignavibacteria bacterium]|nr:tRNA uridine-5-carboxymethylaminomethyl(34) synthesis GTPase MnmE [Ignavibacteria bacterium]